MDVRTGHHQGDHLSTVPILAGSVRVNPHLLVVYPLGYTAPRVKVWGLDAHLAGRV